MDRNAPIRSMLLPLTSTFVKVGASTIRDRFLTRDPLAEQRKRLMSLIRTASTTRFGLDHGFRDLASLEFDEAYPLYQKYVPIRTYSDFWQDYFGWHFASTESGKSLHLDNVTWPGKIKLFCETSGTTAPTKYIPFSEEMFDANRKAAFDLMACYLHNNPKSKLLGGRFLYMSGSTALSSLGRDIHSGDMSAITLKFAPPYLRPFVAPPLEIAELPWDDKLESLAGLLIKDHGFCGISGVPPWILLLLEKVAAIGNKPLRELLPNLELIIHGGTSLAPYRKEFEALFDSRPPRFLEVLPSSEAFMGFQVAGEQQMRLTPYYGAFFEFIPFDEIGENGKPSPDATAVPLEGVKAGERYAIILSTCAGLWRYHIGDTLRFSSIDDFSFQFTGRDRFLDRFEEKVTQSEVEQAVCELSGDSMIDVREFIVGSDIAGRKHLWVLATRGKTDVQGDQISDLLDQSLMRQNADYATFRQQQRINAPSVLTVGEDVIYNWSRDIRGKLGGQSKIPHIDPSFDGELLKSLVEYVGFKYI